MRRVTHHAVDLELAWSLDEQHVHQSLEGAAEDDQ